MFHIPIVQLGKLRPTDEEWGACHQSFSSEAGPGPQAFRLSLYRQPVLWQGVHRPRDYLVPSLPWGRPRSYAGPTPCPPGPVHCPAPPAGARAEAGLRSRSGVTSRTPGPLVSGELTRKPSQAVPAPPRPPAAGRPGKGLGRPADEQPLDRLFRAPPLATPLQAVRGT